MRGERGQSQYALNIAPHRAKRRSRPAAAQGFHGFGVPKMEQSCSMDRIIAVWQHAGGNKRGSLGLSVARGTRPEDTSGY